MFHVEHFEKLAFESRFLTRLCGRPASIRAGVILPPGTRTTRPTYTTAHWTHGFGGDLGSDSATRIRLRELKGQGKKPVHDLGDAG